MPGDPKECREHAKHCLEGHATSTGATSDAARFQKGSNLGRGQLDILCM
jgi:hypothetical protein